LQNQEMLFKHLESAVRAMSGLAPVVDFRLWARFMCFLSNWTSALVP